MTSPVFLITGGLFPSFFSTFLQTPLYLNLDISAGGRCWTIVSASQSSDLCPNTPSFYIVEGPRAGQNVIKETWSHVDSFGGKGVSDPSCCVEFHLIIHWLVRSLPFVHAFIQHLLSNVNQMLARGFLSARSLQPSRQTGCPPVIILQRGTWAGPSELHRKRVIAVGSRSLSFPTKPSKGKASFGVVGRMGRAHRQRWGVRAVRQKE